MSVEGDFLVEAHGEISIILMNRPEKLNAMRRSFYRDLCKVISTLEHDGRTRAIVLTGSGDKAFSAGADISSFGDLKTLDDKLAYMTDAMAGFSAIECSTLPIIAAVNGLALGGGCEITLACDIVIASDKAVFGMPEVTLGLVPGYGVLRAPQVIGRQMTKLMVMAAERLSAEEALDVGLVQRVVPHANLMTTTLALAKKVASYSSLAHTIGKKIINRSVDRSAADFATIALAMLSGSEEAAKRLRESRHLVPIAVD
ncbi:MAG: enoyl-CoA hydratase/isomerase family protein [Candidatus Paceibacterota bacterium]